jgi:type VI protein secretion system component Hcp
VSNNVWTGKLGDKFQGESQREGCEGHIDLESRPRFMTLQNDHHAFGSGLSAPGVPIYSNISVVSRWSSASPGLRLLQDGEPMDVQFFSWYMDPSEKKPAQRVIWTVTDCVMRHVNEGDLDFEPDAFELDWTVLKVETKKQDPKTGALGAGTIVVYDRYKGVLTTS